jgi:hypothetical protein
MKHPILVSIKPAAAHFDYPTHGLFVDPAIRRNGHERPADRLDPDALD